MPGYYDDDTSALIEHERKVRAKQKSEALTYRQKRLYTLAVILVMLGVSCALHFTDAGQKIMDGQSRSPALSVSPTAPGSGTGNGTGSQTINDLNTNNQSSRPSSSHPAAPGGGKGDARPQTINDL